MKAIAKLILLVVLAVSCKKADKVEEKEPVVAPEAPSGTSASSFVTHTRNLSVMYFIPSDLDTVSGWKTRLSDVMIYAQNWYANAMKDAGYGLKTFGLMRDAQSNRVEINMLRGTKTKSQYGRDSKGYLTEINAYYASNPSKKTGSHVLILVPAFGYDNNSVEGPQPLEGVQPFYGSDRYCFAMDNIYMNMALKGVMNAGRNNFAKWVGGMMHEIGHAFNAPHDKQVQSLNQWPGTAFREPIMALSNYFLEVRPCNISPAEAAIFDACEVFNNDSKTYYGAVSSQISKMYGHFDASQNAIVASGKFNSTGTVKKVLYYNDPNVNNEGIGTNNDYNAISFAENPIGQDSFRVVIPVNELQYKSDGMQYELKVKFVHDNGIITEQIYPYTFQGGIPILQFSTRKELSRQGWAVVDYSSQEGGNPASSVLDGMRTTFWHSRWSSNPAGFPHHITLDLGTNVSASGLSYTHREGAYRAIKEFEIQVSSDGSTYRSLGVRTTSQSGDAAQYFDFPSLSTFRYLKIVGRSSWDGTGNAAIAELGLY